MIYFVTPKDLVYENPREHRAIRCHRDLIYEPKMHGALCNRFDLIYDPKMSQGRLSSPWPTL